MLRSTSCAPYSSSVSTASFKRARGEEEPAPAGNNDESYLESAFELNGDEFGQYNQDKHKAHYDNYHQESKKLLEADKSMTVV